jgi:alanine racemase
MSARPSIEARLARAGLPPLHRTAWLEIDLPAIASNLSVIRSLSGGQAVMPVVKAEAYGHGMVPVARTLVAAGADGLCVATLDEALTLRAAGVDSEILVLYPVPPDGVPEASRRGITVAAGSTDALEAIKAAVAAAPNGLAVELEIETGLGRGGASPDGAVTVARAVAAVGGRLSGVWSHLQESEVDAITTRQVERFEAALGRLRAAGIEVPRRHLSASAAILLGTVPSYDAVRPGLISYGLIPDELRAPDTGAPLVSIASASAALRPAMSLLARPVRVADLPVGHGVSYGPTWRASRPSRVATLPVGYGDGWPRALSNRAEVLVRGVRAPVVGNVAMDATMVDVTDVPGPPVDVRDEFVLLGRQGGDEIRAADVARWRTTNSWEVVTAMSGRLARVYDAPAEIPGR